MKNYIQIGTNQGNDDFFNIVKKIEGKANIFLIEPIKDLIPKIEECYDSLKESHNIFILNNGIVTDKKINRLNIYLSNGDMALSSILNRKSYEDIVGVIDFNPLTFEELCETHNIKEIELLYIDTEGYDYTIINSIDLYEIKISKIICEKWDYDIDSTDEIRTGPTFFNETILPKMINYKLEDYNQFNYMFSKI
jgi:FkbM family methyltransferase